MLPRAKAYFLNLWIERLGMIKKQLLLWCFLAMLIGCSTPTVHLNSRYLSESKRTNLVYALKQQGFDVQINQHTFPTGITTNTLIYSPWLRQYEKTLQRLQHTLESQGWSLNQHQLLVAENHWYTADNLGLFLVPHGVDIGAGQTVPDIAVTYQTEDCISQSQLRLESNSTLYFESSNTDFSPFKAKWELVNYPYIRLIQDELYLSFYYQIEQTVVSDQLGKVRVIRLHPISDSELIPDCVMVYGVRE